MQIETGAQPARRVLEGLLARGASRFGSRLAASSAAGQLSFDKLRRDADEVRRRLRGRNDGAAIAAVELDGSTHDLAAIYGVLLAGWHLVALGEGRADPAVAQLDPDAIVAGRTVRLCPRNRERGALQRDLTQCTEPHVLVTSSGSTDRPMLVGFALRSVYERASVECSRIGADDVVAVSGSHGSLPEVVLALAALKRGARLAFIGTGSSSADTTVRSLETLGVTRWSCSATLLAAALARWTGEGAPPGLRRIEVRGEELSRPLARAVLQARPGVEVWHTYGLTESGQGCSWRVTAGDVHRRSFVPVGSTSFDPHVAVDAGQIVIADRRPPTFVSSGPGRVVRCGRRPGALATGDAGRLHPDGTVEYRGRIGERLAAAGAAPTARVAARRVMRAFPQTHAVGVAGAGVVCVSADDSLDTGLDAAARDWGFPVVRLEDPPRLSSGKLDCAAVTTMLQPRSPVDHRSEGTTA